MLNVSCGYASTQYTVNEEPLSFPVRHHQASSLQGHISAPWLRVEALRRAGNKKLHHRPALRGSVDLGHPPYTYDYPLGSPINAETEGHTDSIMSKHRKDRDSWGECTYNISYFIDAQICFLHHAVEARTLPESMFISGSTTKGLFAFSWQMCIYLHLDLLGWERSNAIPSLRV